MKINEQEIFSVSNLKPYDRYKYFIKKVADGEIFFALKNESQKFVFSTLENETLFPVWSAKEFANLCLVEDWKDYNIVKISLDDFENSIVDFLEEKSILLNVFPVSNRTGFVVNLNEFIRDLNQELENY